MPGLYNCIIWPNQKRTTLLVFRWRPTFLTWRMEELQDDNPLHYRNYLNSRSTAFLFFFPCDAKSIYAYYFRYGCGDPNQCYLNLFLKKQFDDLLPFINIWQQKRSECNPQCINFQMGMLRNNVSNWVKWFRGVKV